MLAPSDFCTLKNFVRKPVHENRSEFFQWFKITSNCYASAEEIPEWQHPRRATGNRKNLQCGDDSMMRANATWDMGSPCLGAVGPRSGGPALLVVGFSVLVSILLRSLSMSGAALSTRLMRALRFRGSCSWIGERKGSWMVGYFCSCPGCDVTRHLDQ